MNDLISVIVPIYNVEKYIYKCIDSIINQSYSNLEIILVDDGSTDNCPNICDGLKKNDERITVIHKKNGGLSSARNSGIDISHGKYIVFIDSDDYINVKMIEKLYNVMINQECDIAVCNYYLVYDNSNKKKIRVFLKDNIRITDDTDKYDYLYNEYKMLSVIACNKMYKKEIFEDIRYPEGKLNEDEFIICDLLKKAKKVVYINDALYYYVQRKNSIIHTFNMKKFEILDVIKNRAAFFKDLGDMKNYVETLILEYILTLNLISAYYKSGNRDYNIEQNIINRIFILRKDIFNSHYKNIPFKNFVRLLFPRIYVILKSRKILFINKVL